VTRTRLPLLLIWTESWATATLSESRVASDLGKTHTLRMGMDRVSAITPVSGARAADVPREEVLAVLMQPCRGPRVTGSALEDHGCVSNVARWISRLEPQARASSSGASLFGASCMGRNSFRLLSYIKGAISLCSRCSEGYRASYGRVRLRHDLERIGLPLLAEAPHVTRTRLSSGVRPLLGMFSSPSQLVAAGHQVLHWACFFRVQVFTGYLLVVQHRRVALVLGLHYLRGCAHVRRVF
jgi:hypothetical protein